MSLIWVKGGQAVSLIESISAILERKMGVVIFNFRLALKLALSPSTFAEY